MTSSALRTVLVGAGRVGVGYATDRAMARHFRYSTHAQVLADHPSFDWVATVDPAPAARERVSALWPGAAVAASVDAVADSHPEVAVLAVKPAERRQVLDHLSGLRAVLVEKPLGATAEEAGAFVDECRARGILVIVNFWRRADRLFRSLAEGGLRERIGEPQALTAVYGNGLTNNGSHLVDFVRMLVGEITSVTALAPPRPDAGPLEGDVDVAFGATLANGATLSCHPIDFGAYREVGLDMWGTAGRLSILQEGLVVEVRRRVANRAVDGECEVASDVPESLRSTVSDAFYRMYSNLADCLRGEAEPWSSGPGAVRSTRVVDAILESVRTGTTVDLA